jgi:universal stress protein E
VRKAPCPVLVARGELRLPLQRVLAPVDLSPLSKDAFRFGLNLVSQLAWRGEAEVRAVYALSFLDALALQRQTQKTGEISFEQPERGEAGALRRLVLESSEETPLHLEAAVLQGEARFEILREVSRNPVDLVMLGTHGRSGLDRLVLGSVASTVARKVSCSVLLISPEAALAHSLAEAFAAQTMPSWHYEVAIVD